MKNNNLKNGNKNRPLHFCAAEEAVAQKQQMATHSAAVPRGSTCTLRTKINVV